MFKRALIVHEKRMHPKAVFEASSSSLKDEQSPRVFEFPRST